MTESLSQAIETLQRSRSMLEPVLASFEKRVAQFGADPRSAFWKDEEWQKRRYDILSRLFDEPDRLGGISITDFGCGYGAFFDYLADRPVMKNSRYTGIDMSAAMIEQAEARIDDARATFQHHLIATERADYTFVSGTYNMLMDADRDEWNDYVKASLAHRLLEYTQDYTPRAKGPVGRYSILLWPSRYRPGNRLPGPFGSRHTL